MFHELKMVLERAHQLALALDDEPTLDRLLLAFSKLPASDRETIARVLERDATWCRIVEQTADTTGVTVRPNPQASLYLHVVESAGEPAAYEPLRRDIDVIRFGLQQFVALLPLLFQEDVHTQWTLSARELVAQAPEEVRELARRLAREVLALLEGAPAGAPAASPAAEPAEAPLNGSPRASDRQP